jgi:leucine dehydrogenase
MADFYYLAAPRGCEVNPGGVAAAAGLRELIGGWDGERVYAGWDEPTGSWFFIAVHDTTLGPPIGGCRMRKYPSPALGLRDAMRLAEGMTNKWAGIGQPHGGGKAVIALAREHGGEERLALARRFGRWLERLGGAFETGADYGVGGAELKAMSGETRYVHGLDRCTGEPLDSGAYTALGLLSAIRATAGHVFGEDSLEGRSVVVQGLGQVGAPLARLLTQAGARVMVSDVRRRKCAPLLKEIGAEALELPAVLSTACDVYAPCALGGTLTRRAARALSARAVAGGANNQLRGAGVAEDLHGRGIIYAPDFIVNAGAAIALPMLHRGADEAAVLASLDGIGERLREILEEARHRCEPPLATALGRVRRLLEVGAAGRAHAVRRR